MSAQAAAPIAVHRPLPPEEAARANFYALLARLLNAPPDRALLAAIARSPPPEPRDDAPPADASRAPVEASSVPH